MFKEFVALTFCLVLANSMVSSSGTPQDEKCKELNIYDRFKDDTSPTKYYQCISHSEAKPCDCPYGLVFDEATKSCIWDDVNVELGKGDCESKKPDNTDCGTDQKYDAMIKDCVPEASYYCGDEVKFPDCAKDIHKEKYIADKKNCAGYYYCDANKKRYKGSCPSGYMFNPIKQMCSQSDYPDCKPIMDSTGDSSSGDDNWSKICGNVKNNFIADERLCNAYIYCNGDGVPMQDFCPFGKYFVNGSCVGTPPDTCSCEIYFVETGTPKLGAASHKDKHKWYDCNGAKRTEQDCDGGSIWDAKEESCLL